MAAASGKVAIGATYRGTGKGGLILACQPPARPSRWTPSTSSWSNEQGQIAEHWGHGRHHRHRGPARPAARPRPGACLTAPIGTYAPGHSRRPGRQRSRVHRALPGERLMPVFPWRLSATAPEIPRRISRRQKVSRCLHRTVQHASRALEHVQGAIHLRHANPARSSGCGLAVLRHRSQDRLEVINGVGADLEGDGHVPASTGDDQLMKVAVADDQVPQPAAVDVAALGGQGEQGGVTRSSSHRSLPLLEALRRSGMLIEAAFR
jgi:hypothetical protein